MGTIRYETRTNSTMKHSDLVRRIAKPGIAIKRSLSPEKCFLLHMAVGISTEAAELLDAVKKHVFYCKSLDMENVIEELGDIEFYLEGLRQNVRVSAAKAKRANVKKLLVRYSGAKYTDKKAINRADKR